MINIPDDDALYLSKGMDTEAIEPPHEAKEEPKNDFDLRGGDFGEEPEGKVQTYIGFTLSPFRDNVGVADPPLPPVTFGFFLL